MHNPDDKVDDTPSDAPPEPPQYQPFYGLLRPFQIEDFPLPYPPPQLYPSAVQEPSAFPFNQQPESFSLGPLLQIPINTSNIDATPFLNITNVGDHFGPCAPFFNPFSLHGFSVGDENAGSSLVNSQMFPCSSHAYNVPLSTSKRYEDDEKFSSNTLSRRRVFDADASPCTSQNFFPKRGRPVISPCRLIPTRPQGGTGRGFQPFLAPGANLGDALRVADLEDLVLPAPEPMIRANADNFDAYESIVVGDYVNPFMPNVLRGEHSDVRFKMGVAINMTRYIFLLDSEGFCSRSVYAPFLNRNLYYLKDHRSLLNRSAERSSKNISNAKDSNTNVSCRDSETIKALPERVTSAEIKHGEGVNNKPLLPVTVKFNFIRNNFCFGDRSAIVQCFYTSEVDCEYAPLRRIPSAMFDMKVNEKLRHISIDLPDSFMRRSSKDTKMRKEHFVVRVIFLFEGAEVGGGKRLRKVPSRVRLSEKGECSSSILCSTKIETSEQFSAKEVVMFGAKQLVNYTTENGYNIVHGENSIVLFNAEELKLSAVPFHEWMANPSVFIDRIQRLLRKQFDNPFMSVQVLNVEDEDEEDEDEEEEAALHSSSSLPLEEVNSKATERAVVLEVKTKASTLLVSSTSSGGRTSGMVDWMNGTTVNSAERSVDPNTNTIGQRPSSSAECFIEMPKDARPDCISVTSVDINLIYKNLPDKIAFLFILEDDDIAKDSSSPKDVSLASDDRRDSDALNDQFSAGHAFKPINPNISSAEFFKNLYVDDENEDIDMRPKGPQGKELVRVFNTSYMCFFCFVKLKYPNLGALLFHLRCCHARFRFDYDAEIPVSSTIRMPGFIVRLNNDFDGSCEIFPNRHYIKRNGTQRNGLRPRKCSPVGKSIYIVPNKWYASYVRRSLVGGGTTQKLVFNFNTSLFRDAPAMDVRQGMPFCFDPPTKIDHPWMIQTNNRRLSEITDLHPAERRMMKLWNEFVVKARVTLLGRVMMYRALRIFIDLNREHLSSIEMGVQFLCKLGNLTNHSYLDQGESYDLFMRIEPDYKPWEDDRHYIRQHLAAMRMELRDGVGCVRGSRGNRSGGSNIRNTSAAYRTKSDDTDEKLGSVSSFHELKRLYPWVASKQLSKIWKYLRTYTLDDIKTSQ